MSVKNPVSSDAISRRVILFLLVAIVPLSKALRVEECGNAHIVPLRCDMLGKRILSFWRHSGPAKACNTGKCTKGHVFAM
jgi:hypothetical protein